MLFKKSKNIITKEFISKTTYFVIPACRESCCRFVIPTCSESFFKEGCWTSQHDRERTSRNDRREIVTWTYLWFY